MVRTKADNSARKAVAAKAPRKALAPSRGSSMMSPKSGGKKDKYGGGNALQPWPTPEWQKSITSFFSPTNKPSDKENTDPEAGPSSSKDVERMEEDVPGRSDSPTNEQEEEEVDEREEDEEEEEEEPASSSSSKFTRNNCVSDSDDD